MTTCIRCRGRLEAGACKGCHRNVDGTRTLPALPELDRVRRVLRDVQTPVGACLVAESAGMSLGTWVERVELCDCGSCESRRNKWNPKGDR